MPTTRPICPYVDRQDARCAALFTMTNIHAAYRLCAGDHESCAIYHQIRVVESRHRAELAVTQSS